jgi:outer membrane protein assembly factor BamD (BamD/ComL family)
MADETKRPLKVFLCHASGDKPAVRDLYKRLLVEGVDAWLDQEKLLPGQDWRVEIPRAVKESDVVVICLSNKSITKEGYVQKEIKFALDSAEEKPEDTIFLIPARLEDCVVPEQLGRWQWVDLFEENGFVRLLRSLKLRAYRVGATIEPAGYESEDQETEHRLDQLYTEGLAAFYTEDWDRASQRFQAILRERPNHKNAAEKLAQAERQRNVAKLYTQATEAYQSENWIGAIQALEELLGKSGNYRDSVQLLADAKKRNQLKELYAEAKRLHAAQKWQAVVKVFEQISIIEPTYPDSQGLLGSAQREAAELKRLADLNDLYRQSVLKMDVGEWYKARDLLEQVHKAQIGFLDTEGLLRKVENEIIRIEELKKRDNQINTLYEQAHGLVRSKSWRMVLDKMEEIQQLDHQFVDKDGIFEKAKFELEQENQAAQRQNELAAMYAEASRLLKEGKYQEALEKWEEVKIIDPKYPDRQGVQKTARKRIAELDKTVGRKRIRFSVSQKNMVPVLLLVSAILLSGMGISILMGRPPILPPCTTVSNMNDLLLVESNFSSSLTFVDGKITYPSEWAKSKCYHAPLAAQPPGQGCGEGVYSILFDWFLMNDNQRLYMLVRFSKNNFIPTGIHFSYFYPYPLTDEWKFSDSMGFFGSKVVDQYGWNSAKGKWVDDVSGGGTMNTRAKSSADKRTYWFEFSKPLNSGDGHDWTWKPGDKVGTGLTGDLIIGAFGTSVAGANYGCRMIQLQLGK